MADYRHATQLEQKIHDAISQTIPDDPDEIVAAKKYFGHMTVTELIEEVMES